jgi:hypothetical protein
VLTRIEQGILRAQDRADQHEVSSKPSTVGVVSVLITIIATLVGGAWLVGGQLARLDERGIARQQQVDTLRADMYRVEDRLRGRGNGGGQAEN